VILTTVGARSGKVRKVALMRVSCQGGYVPIGSMGGQPQDPDWVHNVRAHPAVTVREVLADERSRCWSQALAVFARYDEYQARTERTIPVFLAEAVF